MDIKIDASKVLNATGEIIPNTMNALDHVCGSLIKIGGFPILYGREYIDYCLEKTHKKLAKKLDSIPEDKLKSPAPYMVLPLMQDMFTYSAPNCEYLHNMFVNLLASSMNTDMDHAVHPVFVNIIKSLSPIDAKALSSDLFNKNLDFRIYEVRIQKNFDLTHNGNLPDILQLSGIGFSLSNKLVLIENLLDLIGYDTLNQISAVVDNLSMQGIISINQSMCFTDPHAYDSDIPILQEFIASLEKVSDIRKLLNDHKIVFKPMCGKITTLGQNFISCVT